jgi:DNA-directed RNA polymerase subunit K/omega
MAEKEKDKDKELNKFEQVIITSMRARQLSEGVNVTPEMEGRKITAIAVGELEDGSLSFEDEEDDEEDEKDEKSEKDEK